MRGSLYGVEIRSRHGETRSIEWRYYRFRWTARLAVWLANALGNQARFLGETL